MKTKVKAGKTRGAQEPQERRIHAGSQNGGRSWEQGSQIGDDGSATILFFEEGERDDGEELYSPVTQPTLIKEKRRK